MVAGTERHYGLGVYILHWACHWLVSVIARRMNEASGVLGDWGKCQSSDGKGLKRHGQQDMR